MGFSKTIKVKIQIVHKNATNICKNKDINLTVLVRCKAKVLITTALSLFKCLKSLVQENSLVNYFQFPHLYKLTRNFRNLLF